MIARGDAGADTCQHDNPRLVTSQEGVTEDHRQLGRAEWHMLTLCGLTLLSVNSSHAFFQPEQALIDLCTFCLAVFVVSDAV